MEDNNSIRKQVRDWRNRLSPEEVAAASARVVWQCRAMLSENGCLWDGKLLCYYPLKNEVDLRSLYEALFEQGRVLYFPAVAGQDMGFYPVRSLQAFAPGKFGVMEPVDKRDKERFVPEDYGIALVPGVVFDVSGNRLGYGGGYYDRFFAAHQHCGRIGIAYEGQMVPQLHAMSWDVPMDGVVTETGILRFHR